MCDDEFSELRSRYQDRLDDIALLGYELSNVEEEVIHLRALQRDNTIRQYILCKLAESQAKTCDELSNGFTLRTARRVRKQFERDRRLLVAARLFDSEWYTATYSDVKLSKRAPIVHFLTRGVFQLRNPGPHFDSFKYHKAYYDVTEAGIPALLHYIRNGEKENRQIFPAELSQCGKNSR